MAILTCESCGRPLPKAVEGQDDPFTCPHCQPGPGPARLAGPTAWIVLLAAVLTIGFVDTIWLMAVPAADRNARTLTVIVLGLTNFGLAGAFWVFHRSLRKQSTLALAFVCFLPGAAGQAAEPAKPNVLFLFADDQRADTIAALGNPVIKTPNLDRLAARGVAFNRAYMQGGLQGATCVPSRAMLLSGRSLFRVDVKLQRDPTWPAAFGRAGYTTFLTGKWHNGPDSIAASFQKARAVFAGGMTNPLRAPLSDLIDGKLAKPQLAPRHACAVFADEAIRFLKDHKDGPFFCYVAFDAPHDPHIVPEDFPVRYDPAKVPLPPNFLPQHPWDNGDMTGRDERLLPWPRTPDKVRQMLAEYYRYISYLDAQVGRVLDALDASPHAKNTIVVYSADSGVARGSHGLIGKQNVYEHSMRVPLIIAGPGIPAGKRTNAMCYLFDVLPTVGKLCGVPAPRTSEGVEFTASLRDPAKPARPHLMFAYLKVQRAVRDERWKLIRYPQIDRTQLFDLQTDPHETTNLADKPEQAARLAALTALLEKEQKSFGDTAPFKVANPRPAEWTPPRTGKRPGAGKGAGTGIKHLRIGTNNCRALLASPVLDR